MMTLFQLESFDDAEPDNLKSHPEYARGYDEGITAGIESATTAQTALTEELNTQFSDVVFTYVEARHAVLSELAPIFEAIVKGLLPSISAAGLSSKIIETLNVSVAKGIQKNPTISVHPDVLNDLQAVLASDVAKKITLRGDESMSLREAWIATTSEEIAIDFKNVEDAVATALNAYTNPETRKASNA